MHVLCSGKGHMSLFIQMVMLGNFVSSLSVQFTVKSEAILR